MSVRGLGPSPVIAAFFHSPITALIVMRIIFFVVQMLESHVLAPNIVGSSVGVHPLIVIFALLAGAQIGGLLGMLAALPLLAMLKHTLAFYEFKISRAPWAGDDGIAYYPCPVGCAPASSCQAAWNPGGMRCKAVKTTLRLEWWRVH